MTTGGQDPRPRPPRIESVEVTNYRALRHVTLTALAPMTVLIGPNGSGKSTVFAVFAFLSDCFARGVWAACDERGGLGELRSRGSSGPVEIAITYRDFSLSDYGRHGRLLAYRLAVDEVGTRPVILRETLKWKRSPGRGRTATILDFTLGGGRLADDLDSPERDEALSDPDVLAVNTLGQLRSHPMIVSLRRFISDWYLSYLTADESRSVVRGGPQPRLSRSGDNLSNVLQYLSVREPERLDRVLDGLRSMVPAVERAEYTSTIDGRLALLLKDEPFDRPVLARYVSDGTLKVLAYLVLLTDPEPPPFIGIEEPENQLYHTLLPGLAETCRATTDRSQVLVTTHSYDFLNACEPDEVVALYRAGDGYTRAVAARKVERIVDMARHGNGLGWLWQEGYFDLPDPATPADVVPA